MHCTSLSSSDAHVHLAPQYRETSDVKWSVWQGRLPRYSCPHRRSFCARRRTGWTVEWGFSVTGGRLLHLEKVAWIGTDLWLSAVIVGYLEGQSRFSDRIRLDPLTRAGHCCWMSAYTGWGWLEMPWWHRWFSATLSSLPRHNHLHWKTSIQRAHYPSR